MAVPVHLFLIDDGGAMIRGSSDVHDREGSVELRGIISLPDDTYRPNDRESNRNTSALTFFSLLKNWIALHLIFSRPQPRQTLKSAEFRFYHINDAGQEVEYYKITLENVKVISVGPVMHDTRGCPGTGHMEEVALNYEKITHLYKDGNLLAHDAWNERPTA